MQMVWLLWPSFIYLRQRTQKFIIRIMASIITTKWNSSSAVRLYLHKYLVIKYLSSCNNRPRIRYQTTVATAPAMLTTTDISNRNIHINTTPTTTIIINSSMTRLLANQIIITIWQRHLRIYLTIKIRQIRNKLQEIIIILTVKIPLGQPSLIAVPQRWLNHIDTQINRLPVSPCQCPWERAYRRKWEILVKTQRTLKTKLIVIKHLSSNSILKMRLRLKPGKITALAIISKRPHPKSSFKMWPSKPTSLPKMLIQLVRRQSRKLRT